MKKVSFVAAACLLLSVSADAQGWVDVSDPNNTPGGTVLAAMCYDANLQKILLVRGGETWTRDANGWNQLLTATHPDLSGPISQFTCNGSQYFGQQLEGRDYAVFDHQRGGTVLIRRVKNAQPTSSNWYGYYQFFFDGTDWSFDQFWCGGEAQSLIFDANTNSLIRIRHTSNGGFQMYAMDPQGAWQGLGGWLVGPPTLTGQNTAFYDPPSGRIKYLQAQSTGSAYYEYDGIANNWYQCFPSSYPTATQQLGPAAHDGQQGIALGISAPYTLSTIRFSGCEIETLFLPQNPSYRTDYSLAYDELRGVFVLHGGSNYADTWELTLGPGASYSTTGNGCVGTGGTPTLQSANGSLPVAGSQFNVQVSGMPWNTFSFMFLGTQNASYAGVPLPFDLAPVGAPGCVLRTPGTYLYGFPNVLGTGLWTYNVPYLPGQTFYNQAIIFDPTANSLGLTVSNVGEAVIGS